MGRQRLRVGEYFRQRARCNELTAPHPSARTQVENVVGLADGVGIVLDDEHRVAQVAQSLQRPQQTLVIALVQTDARLIEDVEHPDEASANLRRQANALRLAAAQGAAFPVERQVAQPDVLQKAQPRPDFLDQVMRNLLLEFRQPQCRQKLVRPFDREGAQVHDGQAGERDA